MRLIDADALIKELEEEAKAIEEEASEIKENMPVLKNNLRGRADGIRDALIEIIDAPTVEPKTGRWSGVRYDAELGLFVCDNCGKFSLMEYAFCPNCGADMRGDSDE